MQNGDLFLSEKDVALALCLSEIIETLVYNFNGTKRCQAFYKVLFIFMIHNNPQTNFYSVSTNTLTILRTSSTSLSNTPTLLQSLSRPRKTS